jgi:HAE1 family hydrophobic/amphiphilic exporter-1
MLAWSLAHRGVVIGGSILLFAGTFFLGTRLGTELIPQLSQGEFLVDLKLPPGTAIELTDATVSRVQNVARELEHVANTFAVSGSGNRLDANSEQSGENWGEISVTLDPGFDHHDEEEVMRRLRQEIDQIPGLVYKFDRPTLFTTRTPVEVEIAGFDLKRLKSISNDLVARMSASTHFADVKSTMEVGQPEIQIFFDRERAS